MRIRIMPGPVEGGFVVMSPGAKESVPYEEYIEALGRHLSCDWGDCCPEDAKANDEAFRTGERLLSVYHTSEGVKFWIITEADRSSTTVLLPEEY